MNLALILGTLHAQAPLSRADLALQTGLNKATVSSIVRELLDAGWVRERRSNNSVAEVGRPAIDLEPDPEAGFFIGAEIGVDFLSVITADFAAQIVSRRYESTHQHYNQRTVLERLLFLLQESTQQIERAGKQLFGIGLGVPGLVDVAHGRLLFAPNLGWRDLPLRDLVQKQIGAPVFLANEANLAALGESYFGAGQDISYMLYVSSGIGLGGGIVSNGRLVEGAAGFAGEVGHMTVERQGLPCNCGNRGCWETVASVRALFDRIRTAALSGGGSWLTDHTDGDLANLSMPLIVEAACAGDELVIQALHETAEWLGIGIASLMNILNPERVVFGGPLSVAHEYLLPTMRETVRAHAWDWVHDRANIVIAKHGEDAAVMGAVAMVYRELLGAPRPWLK